MRLRRKTCMDEKLRESEERFRQVAENAQEWIWEVDSNGLYTYSSPVVERILGYSPEEITGEKHFYDFFIPQEREKQKEAALGIFARKQPFRRFVNKNLHKNGNEVILETSGMPVLDPNGKLLGYRGIDMDATERWKMEGELKEINHRLKMFLETAREGIITADPLDKITFANKAFADMLGYGEEELLNMDLRRLVDEQGAKRIIEETEVRKSGRISRYELVFCRKDGKLRTVQATASPLWNEDGSYAGALGIMTDVTERNNVEKALLESQQKFERLFKSQPDPTVFADMHDCFLDVNPRFVEVFGYSPDEVRGKALDDLLVPEDKKDEAQMLAKKSTGEYVSYETVRRRKDGSTIPVSLSAAPIIVDGQFAGNVITYTDITERKLMEKRLRESEARFRGITERSFDTIATIDPDGKISYVSPSVERIVGYKAEEIIGKPFQDYFTSSDVSEVVRIFAETLQGKSSKGIILKVARKDGAFALAEVNASPMIEDGEVVGIQGVARDITERKRMEDALRESEEKHRLLFENVNDVVFSYDSGFTVLSVSPSVEKALGYKPEELVGRKFQELNVLAPESLETAMTNALRVFRGEQTSPSVYEFVKKDGTKGFGEITSSPLVREGKVTGVIAVARDITERKKMEQKIRESEERLKQLIEFAPDAIYVNDLNGVFLDGNKQAETITGYKKEELLGRNMLETGLLPKEQVTKAMEMLAKNIAGQRAGPDELELVRKDGTRIWVEISTFPVKRGESVEVLGVARDVTERKRMEEALRESEEKTRNILQSSPDAIAVTDLNGTMIDCNQAALELAGVLSKDELLGKNTFDLISPKEHEKSMKNIETLLERGTIRDFEFALVAKDGREFPAEVSMSLMKDPTGAPKYFVATIKDISERKQMQQKLQEYSQQLEVLVEKRTKQLQETQEQLVKSERLAAIGQVAAMVGHDLRNPLTGIKGAAYYLKTKAVVKADKKAMEMLELIEKDIEYSNKIIKDLLEYSREIHLERTETTPRIIIEETFFLLETPDNIQMENLAENEPEIKVDIEKLDRVFVNIIKNAFDAMPNGGKLTIASRKTNGNIEFSFTDTGIGMTREHMAKIWTPFFTTKAKGMGLGLPICKRIVEAHRGRIAIESTIGTGTTLTITLPMELETKEEGGGEIWVNAPESSLSTTTKASEKS